MIKINKINGLLLSLLLLVQMPVQAFGSGIARDIEKVIFGAFVVASIGAAVGLITMGYAFGAASSPRPQSRRPSVAENAQEKTHENLENFENITLGSHIDAKVVAGDANTVKIKSSRHDTLQPCIKNSELTLKHRSGQNDLEDHYCSPATVEISTKSPLRNVTTTGNYTVVDVDMKESFVESFVARQQGRHNRTTVSNLNTPIVVAESAEDGVMNFAGRADNFIYDSAKRSTIFSEALKYKSAVSPKATLGLVKLNKARSSALDEEKRN